jgi:hypothetical protein
VVTVGLKQNHGPEEPISVPAGDADEERIEPVGAIVLERSGATRNEVLAEPLNLLLVYKKVKVDGVFFVGLCGMLQA